MRAEFEGMQVDVYPVGLLAALLYDWRGLTRLRMRPTHVLRSVRYMAHQARRGRWRAVRMTFNGYLAEPSPLPPGLTRVGSGWTRRRALRSLARNLPGEGS